MNGSRGGGRNGVDILMIMVIMQKDHENSNQELGEKQKFNRTKWRKRFRKLKKHPLDLENDRFFKVMSLPGRPQDFYECKYNLSK